LLGLGSAIGLLRLREWARLLTLLLAAIMLVWDVPDAVRTPNVVNVFIICWTLYVIWYFLRPSVKAQFK